MAKEGGAITEKEVEHLLELSRMEIQDKEKKKLADELNGILDYVRELEKIPTAEINLDAGDFSKKDLRTDQPETEKLGDWEKLIDAFSERKERWLKIPPVFDR